MKVKMLMFAKTSIFSFVYDMIDVFCFPEDNQKVQAIFDKYKIEKCFLYQNVTDTDNTSLFFVFICNFKITDYWKRIEELVQDNKTQNVIEFDSGSSIKSVTIQRNPNVKTTTQFMKVKMQMFAKTSIFSFVYDMIDVFRFPEDNPKVQAILDKHKIQKGFFVSKCNRHKQCTFILSLYLEFKLSTE